MGKLQGRWSLEPRSRRADGGAVNREMALFKATGLFLIISGKQNFCKGRTFFRASAGWKWDVRIN
jgi:hypothetical protein